MFVFLLLSEDNRRIREPMVYLSSLAITQEFHTLISRSLDQHDALQRVYSMVQSIALKWINLLLTCYLTSTSYEIQNPWCLFFIVRHLGYPGSNLQIFRSMRRSPTCLQHGTISNIKTDTIVIEVFNFVLYMKLIQIIYFASSLRGVYWFDKTI